MNLNKMVRVCFVFFAFHITSLFFLNIVHFLNILYYKYCIHIGFSSLNYYDINIYIYIYDKASG